ncbi:MAG: hypothetical protein WAQ33_09250 [Gaiellaceae bacterium]
MTTTVVLNLVFSVLAVGGLVGLTRLAALVAGGRFDEAALTNDSVRRYELERAA